MSKIKVSNIMKVMDIHVSQVNQATVHYLKNYFVTYRDRVMREDLISLENAIEDLDQKEYLPKNINTPIIIREVRRLHTLAGRKDCAYVRFINI